MSVETTPEVPFSEELAKRFGDKAALLPGETAQAYASRMAFLGMLFIASKESLRALPGALALKQAVARGALVQIGEPEDAVSVVFEKPKTLSEVRAIRKAAESGKTVGYVDGSGNVVRVKV